MQQADVFLALASFLGGVIVIARVARWVHGLVAFSRRSPGSETVRMSAFAVPALLHSGPWMLVLAIWAVTYASTSQRVAVTWAVDGGVGTAVVFDAALITWAFFKRRRAATASQPLTPERLLEKRRRFFLINTLSFGAVFPAYFAIWPIDTLGRDPAFLVIIFACGLVGGWVWSWIMWQWYGASLEVSQRARKKREDDAGVRQS